MTAELRESKYGPDYWTIDKRMERAADSDNPKGHIGDFRLTRADCERLNKALRLLRGQEAMAAEGFDVAEHLLHCPPDECGVCQDMAEMLALGNKVKV